MISTYAFKIVSNKPYSCEAGPCNLSLIIFKLFHCITSTINNQLLETTDVRDVMLINLIIFILLSSLILDSIKTKNKNKKTLKKMRLNDKSNKSKTKKKLQMKRFSINYSRTVFHIFSCWNHVDLRSFPLKTKNYWKPFWIADILCLSRRPCWVELCLSSLASCAWFQSAGPQQQPSSSTTTRWWSRPWREKWDHQSTSAGPPPCCSCWAVLWSASSAGRRREPHLLTTPTCRTAQTFSSATLRPAWPVWDLMP